MSVALVFGSIPSAQARKTVDLGERTSLLADSLVGEEFVLEGFVLGPDGNRAEGAVVVSSAGGHAVTDAAGNYRIQVRVPPEATSVQVMAVANVRGNLVASSSVALGGAVHEVSVDPIWLTGSSCSPAWLPTFGGEPGTNDYVTALAAYDDGGGPALFAGGHFSRAGGMQANRIAKWDGSSWAPLGSGVNGFISALAVYDDGGGPALYVGGFFVVAGAVHIAKWDGSSWSKLGPGISDLAVIYALAVYDDGGGPALHVGGNFRTAWGVRVNHVAKWNGSRWSALANGIGNSDFATVSSLTVYDDGGGAALYAGGSGFGNNIARWDGASWSTPGGGMDGPVPALATFDDGEGPALFAGGNFTSAGGVPAGRIGRWDGKAWSALASGIDNAVDALAVHDDGRGRALYAAGRFTKAVGVPAGRLAKWDGSSWSALAGGMNGEVRALAEHDDGGGPALYAGGDFTTAATVAASRIAQWNGSKWTALGGGMDSRVRALAVYDDGRGPALYAAGDFTTADGAAANRIARWDGARWSALGSGTNGPVRALAVFDDGTGPALYAGGAFTSAGGVAASRSAKWDGSRWSALGRGVNGLLHALAVHDDGSGPALYAGGQFTAASGVEVNRIARWDGSSWSALGSGIGGSANRSVFALAVHDDGAGPALFAGGSFPTAGGVAANGIARWDGSSWTPLGSGVSSAVLALAVFDGPGRGGPALFAGGEFSSAFDSGDSYLARWQGCPDTTPPLLSCPASITATDPRSGPPGEIVTFTVAASDDRDASPSVVCEPPSGSFFPPGVTLVQCKATDGARNQSNCSFPVVVQRKQGK